GVELTARPESLQSPERARLAVPAQPALAESGRFGLHPAGPSGPHLRPQLRGLLHRGEPFHHRSVPGLRAFPATERAGVAGLRAASLSALARILRCARL